MRNTSTVLNGLLPNSIPVQIFHPHFTTGTSCKAVLNSCPDNCGRHVSELRTHFGIHMRYCTFAFCLFFPPSINFSAAILLYCAPKDPVTTGRAKLPPLDCWENQKWRLKKKGGPRGEKTSYKQISSWSRGRQPLRRRTGAGSCLQLRPKDLQGSGMPKETQQSAKQYNMNQQQRLGQLNFTAGLSKV